MHLLTQQEIDILDLLAQGRKMNEIARSMGLHAQALKRYMGGIYDKLCPELDRQRYHPHVRLGVLWSCPLFREGALALRRPSSRNPEPVMFKLVKKAMKWSSKCA